MKSKSQNNEIAKFADLPGTENALAVLNQTSYSDDIQKLLLMDYINMGFDDIADFQEYIQSERVREEYEALATEDGSGAISIDQYKDITKLLDMKDYYGANALIDKKLSCNPVNGFLRLLKIIASVKGKNPAVLTCNEVKTLLASLSELVQNEECGVSAIAIHNAIVLIFEYVNGVKFKLLSPDDNFESINEDTVYLINYLNIPKLFIEKTLKTLEK